MTAPTDAERALYADLTQMTMRMRGESLALVEAAIEERFRAFARTHTPGRISQLEITQTYIVHDAVEPWTEYRTEYRVAAASIAVHDRDQAMPAPLNSQLAERRGNVVPFSAAFAGPRDTRRLEPGTTQRGNR